MNNNILENRCLACMARLTSLAQEIVKQLSGGSAIAAVCVDGSLLRRDSYFYRERGPAEVAVIAAAWPCRVARFATV